MQLLGSMEGPPSVKGLEKCRGKRGAGESPCILKGAGFAHLPLHFPLVS